MKKQYLFVANWKMSFSFNETIEFATTNFDNLIKLVADTNQHLVLCPSTESIYPLTRIFQETAITIGAQTCSRHTSGSFTGQVPPKNLQEVGCTHCIIGHSETRSDMNELNESIALKCIHLLDYDLTPIVCIGETKEEYDAGKTLDVLAEQLSPLLEALAAKTTVHPYLTPCISYEPIWAIGTGQAADTKHLDTIYTWLAEKLKSTKISWKLLYGGSVTPENVESIKKIRKIDGFLIGGASLDFQKLEKIVQ